MRERGVYLRGLIGLIFGKKTGVILGLVFHNSIHKSNMIRAKNMRV